MFIKNKVTSAEELTSEINKIEKRMKHLKLIKKWVSGSEFASSDVPRML